jgi:quercetin dioxygenase-like cupin family protein
MASKKQEELMPVGLRIRAGRKKKQVSLDRLARDIGQTKGFLEQIERGEAIPPVGVLLQIARALELDTDSLLKAQEARLDDRVEAYVKRSDNYAYTTLTPGAEQSHLKAFKVTVAPAQTHEGVGYHHHGEEFIYVLDGVVEVVVGGETTVLGVGQSIHFDSGRKHQIKNLKRKKAQFLVVIYGP